MDTRKVFSQIKNGLIVSCQALEEEPLHDSYIMSKIAYACMLGGAVGIRANSVSDIKAIKSNISLPIIGIIKKVYDDSQVYITPTIKEVDELVQVGVDIIAVDATKRRRPFGDNLESFFEKIKKKYPNQIFMADCSNFEEGINAEKLGFDLVGTTLSGYTEYTKNIEIPNYELIKSLVNNLNIPVIAEGGIWYPEQLEKAMDFGAFSAVIGTAITRPKNITERFVRKIKI